jgi:hypothetical protein
MEVHMNPPEDADDEMFRAWAEQLWPQGDPVAVMDEEAVRRPIVEAGTWQRFADFAEPFAEADPDVDLALMELRWSLEAMSDPELDTLFADCTAIAGDNLDTSERGQGLAGLLALVAETARAGAVDETYLIAACLAASDCKR